MTLLSMVRGDQAVFDLTFTDGAGDPLDLTGIELDFIAKYRIDADDADAVITKDEADGIAVDADPTTGLAVLTIDPADTTALEPAWAIVLRLPWRLVLTNGADVRTPIDGELEVGRV